MVDRADGVDNFLARQCVCVRDLRLPRERTAKGPALRQQARARSTVYGAVDTTTAQKRTVGGVDNGAILQLDAGDIGAYDAYSGVYGARGGVQYQRLVDH